MKNIKNLGLLALMGLIVLLVMISGCINECGKLNQKCCADNKCNEGVCSNGICEKCGGIDELCCPGNSCKEGTCLNTAWIGEQTRKTPHENPWYCLGDHYNTTPPASPLPTKNNTSPYNHTYSVFWQEQGDIPDFANGNGNTESDFYFNPRIKMNETDFVPAHDNSTATEWCKMVPNKNYFRGESATNWANPLGERKKWIPNQNKWITIQNSDYPRYYRCEDLNNTTKPVSPSPTKKSYSINIECEDADDYTAGDPNNIIRSNASKKKVLGQFGCAGSSPYGPKSGYAKYKVQIPEAGNWFISVAYSCQNAHSVPIDIYVDDEQKPRASFYPENTLDWNAFQKTIKINLGAITSGSHNIIFKTGGAKYGVADLDYFVLSL